MLDDLHLRVGGQGATGIAGEASAYQLLPPLSLEEYEALKADIAARGVQVPVEYDEHGRILDGHHRVRACQELGIKDWPRVIRAGMSEEEKIEHVLALNLSRRHLTREQRRELVLRLRQQGWSLRRIAERLGVPKSTIHDDVSESGHVIPATVTGADGKRYPASRPQVKPSVFVADRRQHERVAEAIREAADVLPAKYLEPKRVERIAREARAERAEKEPLPSATEPAPDIVIHHCDFRDLDLPPASVDLIFTDPPYPKEYLSLWSDLAAFAKRVLRPGGLLVAYTGQFWLPDVIRQLDEHLEYVWCGTLVTNGPHNNVHARHIRSRAKPILFYCNGEYAPGPWFDDAYWSEGRQKEDHDWQQSLGAAVYYIAALTRPGALVVDPFVGSGTTAVAARRMRRRFVGCDIDSAAVRTARERVAADEHA